MVYRFSNFGKRVFDCSQQYLWEKEKIAVSLPPLWENLRTYVKKSRCCKILQYITTWYMNRFTLSYPLQYAKRLEHNFNVNSNVFKKPDESLIGQCKHNITQRFLLVSLLWYRKVDFDKSLILSSSLYLELFFISIHQQCMVFWIGIGHTLMEGKMEIKLVHEIDLVCDHF